LEENLLAHVAESSYPPKIAQIIQKQSMDSRVIPSIEETNQIIYVRQKPAQESVIQEELAKMRKILGIDNR